MQYPLADVSSIMDLMASLIHNSPSARAVAGMLLAMHLTMMRGSQIDQLALTIISR